MRRFTILLCFTLICEICSSLVIDDYILNEYNLTWPTEFHFRAEKTNLKTGIIETYEVWYSEEQNRSRIDFYEGTVKRYSFKDPEEKYVTVYEIHPRTTVDLSNVLECKKSMMDENLDNYLPTEDFTYEGEITYDGKVVQVWQSEVVKGDIFKYESLLYTFETDDGDFVPIRYEKKRFNEWNTVLDGHVITEFYHFQRNVSADDLNSENVEECEDAVTSGESLEQDLTLLHPHLDADVDKAFHRYKTYHGRNYKQNENEIRKLIFEENWRRVVDHNRKHLGYKLGINKFSDRLDEEMVHLTGARPADHEEEGTVPFAFSDEELKALEEELPDNYDMRQDGVISPVKNQADCGSCWAFSTTAAIEAVIARNNGGRNIDLSEQSLIDCAWSASDGCNGGFLYETFKYVTKHGMPTQREYGPYLAQDGYCKLNNMTTIYTIKGFGKVPSLSESALKAVLYKIGPVTVTINAETTMMHYSSGIYYEPKCNKGRINHAVTVVGYGVRDGTKYWIVKNSWGEDWGEDGYILMSTTNNNCWLMTDAYYPIV